MEPKDPATLSGFAPYAILCWLVMKEVFGYLKNRDKNKEDEGNGEIKEWIERREMEKSLSLLVKVSEKQTDLAEEILSEQRALRALLTKSKGNGSYRDS